MEGKDGEAYERSIKRTSRVDMENTETRMRANKQKGKQAAKEAKRQTSKRSNKRWCLRETNVGLDLMSITSLC